MPNQPSGQEPDTVVNFLLHLEQQEEKKPERKDDAGSADLLQLPPLMALHEPPTQENATVSVLAMAATFEGMNSQRADSSNPPRAPIRRSVQATNQQPLPVSTPQIQSPTTTAFEAQSSTFPNIPSTQTPQSNKQKKSYTPNWKKGFFYLGSTSVCTALGLYGYYKLSPDDWYRPVVTGASIIGASAFSLLSVENFFYKEDVGGPIQQLLNYKKK